MLLTLSEDRTVELIRQLEDVNDSAEEILYHFKRYGTRLFEYAGQFGLTWTGQMFNLNGKLADFKFELNCGRDPATNGFNWSDLNAALSTLNPVGVTVERDDIWKIADPLFGKGLYNAWAEVKHNLEKLSVAEVQPTVEAWLQHCGLHGDKDLTPLNVMVDSVFDELGVEDPLKHHREVEEFRRREIEEANQPSTNWGVEFEGKRY